MVTTLTTATRTRKARKSAEQRKHEHFLKLAVLVRQGRIHRHLMAEAHEDHTFADGEHVDFYQSETYPGFAYMVVYGASGYECGCKSYEYRHSCEHTKDAAERAVARYEESKRQAELATAEQVAPLVLGESFAADLPAHIDDEMPAQEPYVLSLRGQRCADPVVVLDDLGAHVIYRDECGTVISRFCRVDELSQLCPAGYRTGRAEDYPQFFPDAADRPQVPGSCDCCGRASKKSVCAWCAGVAA